MYRNNSGVLDMNEAQQLLSKVEAHLAVLRKDAINSNTRHAVDIVREAILRAIRDTTEVRDD